MNLFGVSALVTTTGIHRLLTTLKFIAKWKKSCLPDMYLDLSRKTFANYANLA